MPPDAPTGPDDSAAGDVAAEPDDATPDHTEPDAAAEDDTDPAGAAADAVGTAEQADPAQTVEPEPEGPRRRARRERAERREAQARAQAIEQARREAKRRVTMQSGEATGSVSRGAIRGLKMALAVVLAVAGLVGLALVLYFTPLMSARSIEVTGVQTVPREEVLDAAQVQPGTPLLQIDTGAVAERVATIRRVASTRVQRQYPSTLRIAVVERVPVVVKDFSDGPHLYDRDGVDFATAPPPTMLPYLDVEHPGPDDPATKAALQVITALAPDVAARISRVDAPSVASITLTLIDGRVVIWGGAERTAEKAQKLAALLTQPGRVYDVSSPDLPTVR